jgi:hypothetical protein
VTPRAASLGIALLLAACERHAPEPAVTAEPRPAPAPVATAEPVASARAPGSKRPAASAQPRERCDVDLPATMEFLQCNPKPRTLDYPDCRTYTVARLDGDETCQPARLSLGVSGFQAILDELRVEVRWELGPPRRGG